MMKVKKLFLILIFSLFSFSVFLQDSKNQINIDQLETLPRLSSYEASFKQYCKLIENNYKNLSAGRAPLYKFYRYHNTENFTLQGLASRCNIPYETIATLNGLESSDDKINNKTLILPTVPGLFIPDGKGLNSIEILLKENYANKNENLKGSSWTINGRPFTFLQNKRFSSTERAYFLDSSMQLPLARDSFYISSEFGKRINPFSGEMKTHNGIDFACDEGTPVYAIKDGAAAYVIENDPVFGNYVILSHDLGKMTSVYAHLQSSCISQYQSVKKGDIIGYVGKTGQATGPHLHFEIRQGGKAQNPREKFNL